MSKFLRTLLVICLLSTSAQAQSIAALRTWVYSNFTTATIPGSITGYKEGNIIDSMLRRIGLAQGLTLQQVTDNGNVTSNSITSYDGATNTNVIGSTVSIVRISDGLPFHDMTVHADVPMYTITGVANSQSTLYDSALYITDGGAGIGLINNSGLCYVRGTYEGSAYIQGDVQGGELGIGDYANNWYYHILGATAADSPHYYIPYYAGDILDTFVMAKTFLPRLAAAATFGFGLTSTLGTNTVNVRADTGSVTTVGRLYKVVDSGLAISGNGIVSSFDLTGQTIATSNTYSTGSSTLSYNVTGYIAITAIVTDVLNYSVQWTDENSNVQTQTLVPIGGSTVSLSTTGFYTFPQLFIRAKNGTTIYTSVTFTTGSGSVSFDFGGRVIQQ